MTPALITPNEGLFLIALIFCAGIYFIKLLGASVRTVEERDQAAWEKQEEEHKAAQVLRAVELVEKHRREDALHTERRARGITSIGKYRARQEQKLKKKEKKE